MYEISEIEAAISSVGAFVARVVPLAPPPTQYAVFNQNDAWVSDGITIKQSIKQLLNDNEVTIDVVAWSKERSSWRGFVGSVTESRAAGIVVGTHFVGITNSAQLLNRVNCSIEGLARVDELDPSLADDALSMVIGASAIGPTRLASSGRGMVPLRILFPEVTEVNQLTANFFNHPTVGAQVSFGPPSKADQFTLIVVDSFTASAHSELESWLIPKTGQLFVWDTILHRESETKPWSIGYALSAALKLRGSVARSGVELIHPLDLVKTLPFAVPELSLFRGNKVYIILGGASDLGVHMSLWMYKNGAAHIILTSRRGSAFFDESASAATKQKIAYLKGRPDLHLRVESFDATSAERMFTLAQSIDLPIGGCFISTLVMSDMLFMSQKPKTFHMVSDLKYNVFKAFTSAFDIQKLDFLVSLSTMIAVIGNAGQSSYAAGSALMDGALSKYPNAFSMMLPAISGLGFFDRMDVNVRADLGRAGFTPDHICASIGDALLKLTRGDVFSRYIPDVSWNIMEQDNGLPPSCRHLIVRNASAESALQHSQKGQDDADGRDQIFGKILAILDVSETDFSPILPFTSFGLDSLGATRISAVLRPYVNISQMQLLGGISWGKIQERMKDDR